MSYNLGRLHSETYGVVLEIVLLIGTMANVFKQIFAIVFDSSAFFVIVFAEYNCDIQSELSI